MPVLFTADLHLTDNLRDQYRHEYQSRLRALVEKRRIDLCVILGDLTEAFDHHSARLTNAVAEHVYKLSKISEVMIVKGNHDSTDPEHPFFRFLQYLPNVHFVSDKVTLPDQEMGKTLVLPHTANPNRDWGNIADEKCDTVLVHATFTGAMANGHQLSGISQALLPKKAKTIIAGDVHTPQKVGRVLYVGAPYTVDFGDDYEGRVLVLKDGALESVPLQGPQKRLVEITSLADLKKIKAVDEGDIVKVRVLGTMAEHAKMKEMESGIREWGEKAGCHVNSVQLVVSEKARKATRAQIIQARTDPELVRAYGRHRGIDERLIKAGLTFVEGK